MTVNVRVKYWEWVWLIRRVGVANEKIRCGLCGEWVLLKKRVGVANEDTGVADEESGCG